MVCFQIIIEFHIHVIIVILTGTVARFHWTTARRRCAGRGRRRCDECVCKATSPCFTRVRLSNATDKSYKNGNLTRAPIQKSSSHCIALCILLNSDALIFSQLKNGGGPCNQIISKNSLHFTWTTRVHQNYDAFLRQFTPTCWNNQGVRPAAFFSWLKISAF